MTSRRQSQQHRIPTRSILLSPKQRTVIAAWNVRTMYEQGKAAMVAMEMKSHNISLLGIAETRWIQTGQFRLSTGELILYSGHTHNGAPHTEATISKANLWETTGQAPVRQEMTSRKWTWIGHTLRRPNYCIARQALRWNPQGSRRRGRPRNSWRRDTDHTIQSRGLSWHQLEHLSRDRGDWRDFVSGLCSEME